MAVSVLVRVIRAQQLVYFLLIEVVHWGKLVVGGEADRMNELGDFMMRNVVVQNAATRLVEIQIAVDHVDAFAGHVVLQHCCQSGFPAKFVAKQTDGDGAVPEFDETHVD